MFLIKMVKNSSAINSNPCFHEQEQSYKCLSDNGYNQDKCSAYFDNYNTCKKFWGKIYSDRRAKGITPFLPDIEEREKIKADFKNSVYNK